MRQTLDRMNEVIICQGVVIQYTSGTHISVIESVLFGHCH